MAGSAAAGWIAAPRAAAHSVAVERLSAARGRLAAAGPAACRASRLAVTASCPAVRAAGLVEVAGPGSAAFVAVAATAAVVAAVAVFATAAVVTVYLAAVATAIVVVAV